MDPTRKPEDSDAPHAPGNLSHEIRTPLNGIMGTLELLLASELAPAQRELVATAQASAEELLKRLEQIPGFADPDAGNSVFAAGMFGGPLQLRALFALADPHHVDMLSGQLGQAGLDATGVESAAAVLNAMEQAAAGEQPFQVAILDQRLPGVDGETLGAALKSDPAYRDLKLILVGPPSGADVSQRLARAGFAAWLSWPVQQRALEQTLAKLGRAIRSGKEADFIAVEPRRAGTPAAAANASPFAGYRVLVADDVHVNRQVALRLLETLGCQAEAAVDGKQAVTLHAQRKFDLILMDCQMPKMDGYQATAAIRAAESDCHTPIIAVTASTIQGERERCAEAGMDGFLAKPVRLRDLSAVLKHWFAPRDAAASQASPAQQDDLDATFNMFGKDFAELAHLYMTDSPKRISALQRAAAMQDTEQAAKMAHSLSGSCVSIGATSLAAICKDVELRCKAADLANIEAQLLAIANEYARVEARLRDLIASH